MKPRKFSLALLVRDIRHVPNGNYRAAFEDKRHIFAAKAKKICLKHLREFAILVTPRTLLDWHQRLIARKYDSNGKRSPGYPPGPDNLHSLILKKAAENLSWGYTRIQGAHQNLDREIGRRTITEAAKPSVTGEVGTMSAPSRITADVPEGKPFGRVNETNGTR